MNKDLYGDATIIAHHGEDRSLHYGAVIPPLYQTSLFTFESMEDISAAFRDEAKTYIYTRGNNPTAMVAEKKIAALEHGGAAKLFASGMGAISAAIFSSIRKDSHIVAVKTIYGPTIKLLTDYLNKRFGIETTFVSADADEIISACRKETSLIYLESPTSLVFEIIDLRKVATFARANGIRTVIDNSYSTPIYQKPLDFGIDISVHSVSKYIAGHSDLVAGVLITSEEILYDIMQWEHPLFGAKIAPFEAWLILRGLRTLPVRMRQHSESAKKVAEFLAASPKVLKVNYPGLANHPNKKLADSQMTNSSGLMSFILDADLKQTHRFVDRLELFKIGVSWGGFESLALALARDGSDPSVPHGLIRISVGLEDVDDLIADLQAALDEL